MTDRTGMGPTRGLRREALQVFRFGLIGVLATAVHMTVALVLNVGLGVAPQAANLAAFATAFVVSFLGHHSFSFRSTQRRSRTLPRFVVAAGSGYLASAALLAQLEATSLPTATSLIVSAGVIPAVSYLVNKYWVF